MPSWPPRLANDLQFVEFSEPRLSMWRIGVGAGGLGAPVQCVALPHGPIAHDASEFQSLQPVRPAPARLPVLAPWAHGIEAVRPRLPLVALLIAAIACWSSAPLLTALATLAFVTKSGGTHAPLVLEADAAD